MYPIAIRKRKDGLSAMKNKLAALLAALLLSFSLLPAQALASSPTDPGTPPPVSEQNQPETPDAPDSLGDLEFPAPPSGVSAQSEGPGPFGDEH